METFVGFFYGRQVPESFTEHPLSPGEWVTKGRWQGPSSLDCQARPVVLESVW